MNERCISITVFGRPQPQGSVKAFMVGGKPRLTSANANLKPYRHTVTQVALEQICKEGMVAPLAPRGTGVALVIQFNLARPKSLPKRERLHIRKPDADKLLRAVLDALTGVVYDDDSQVVSFSATKHYCNPGEPENTKITAIPYPYSET